MSLYRLAKTAIRSFNTVTSKITTTPPCNLQQFRGYRHQQYFKQYHNVTRSQYSSKNTAATGTSSAFGFTLSSLAAAFKPRYRLNGQIRYSNVDKNRVIPYTTGVRCPPPRYYAPAYASNYVLSAILFVCIIGYSKEEIVPYTKRTRTVGMTPKMEKRLGEIAFCIVKWTSRNWKILDDNEPRTVKVRSVMTGLVEALKRGIQQETVWGDIRNCEWERKFIEGLNFEVFVLEKNVKNAFCLPGGRIVIYTGLLDKLTTDAQIATIVGHEMAHAIARHAAEKITRTNWFDPVEFVLNEILPYRVYSTLTSFLYMLPMDRQLEIEADYIGLLLMASAGHDPRGAPEVYDTILNPTTFPGEDYLFSHPSGQTRARLLKEVMEEALTVYDSKVELRKCKQNPSVQKRERFPNEVMEKAIRIHGNETELKNQEQNHDAYFSTRSFVFENDGKDVSIQVVPSKGVQR